MQIAVVVVSYNTRAYLERCLHSIQAAILPANTHLHVIVVDNASHDGSAEMVAATFPAVQLLASTTNLGFTGGNNLALSALGFPAGSSSQAPPDYVLLLNPDAELATDALIRFFDFMQATPHAAVCGAHLTYGNGSFQDGAFHFPGLAQVALDLFPLHRLPAAHRLYRGRVNGRYPSSKWQGIQPFPVDFVLGAAMFVRGSAITASGGLDDGYFMYCEEMDWCLRFAAAGWRVYALPTAHVVHHEGQSSRQVRWSAYARLWRSRFRFFGRYPERYSPAFRVALRLLVRSAAAWHSAQARRRFAHGHVGGQEVAAELAAYAILARL